jgi:hypothetical protein
LTKDRCCNRLALDRRRPCLRSFAPQWTRPYFAVTAAFVLAVVAGSFATVILGGYGVAQLISGV